MLRDVFLLLVSDSAQTFPSFVYLIPAIMLFGITDIAVIFAIMIFAMVPLIRYTIEGLRNVPPEMTESADMSGATRSQKLWKVQFPLALPTMAVGFNQALMFAFFMTMIAAFIGTIDVGQELQRTLAGTDLGKNDRREDYLRATLSRDNGQLVATPFPKQDSSMFSRLAAADCLLIREPHAEPAKAGTNVEIIRLSRSNLRI